MSRDTKRFLIKFTAVIVAVVSILYIVLSVYRKSWNPVKWFDTPQTNIQTENQTQNTQSGLVSPEEVEMNGIKITAATLSAPMYEAYGATRGAEAALTLTVTPTPADAELTGAKFTIAFKNASSSWATGKTVTEYVTLSQSNEKAATVSCLKAFGEPIVITYTVTGEKGESKSATYQLDYRARIISDDDWTFTNVHDSNNVLGESATIIFKCFDEDLESTLYLSDYTIDTKFTGTAKFTVLDYLYNTCQEKGLTLPNRQFDAYVFCTDPQDGSFSVQITTQSITSTLLGNTAYKTEAFRNCLDETGCEDGQFKFEIEFTDNYTTYKVEKHFDLDSGSLPKAAQSVQFADGSQHIF